MNQRGVALVVVLWVIMVLSLLIGGFAFTMHVETQVASYGRKDVKAQMLAYSGIEAARYSLILDAQQAGAGDYNARNQFWATNTAMYAEHTLGEGKYNVTMIDEESKLPINRLTADQLHRLFDLLAVDPSEADVLVDSFLDWTDEDDLHRLNGAENEYYAKLEPPYNAKNAAMDRVEELLLVRGMTREIFSGKPATESDPEVPALTEALTTLSSGMVNVNTASSFVLQVLGLTQAQVDAVLERRNGPDGVAGTEDDQPFRSTGEFQTMLGTMSPQSLQLLQAITDVHSSHFTAKATGNVGGVERTVRATLKREGAEVSIVGWRESRGGS